jgi:hypothetical protein
MDPNIRDIEVFPEEYKVFRNDRKKKDTDKEGRGVLIAVKKDLISSDVYKFTPPDKAEMVWAKIEIADSKTLYLGSYYNPKTSDENSLKNFETMIRK